MRRRAALPALERLDEKTLPSASVTAALVDGTLAIRGSDLDEQIVVGLVQGRLAIRSVGQRVAIDVAGVGRFPLADVRAITIEGGAGNDSITLNFARRGISVMLDGGVGNDLIRGSSAAETIRGGLGNDTIKGRGGRDIIDAGPGANLVNGRAVNIAAPAPSSSTPVPSTPSIPTTKPTYTVTSPPPTLGPDITGWVDRIMTLVNQERTQRGLSALVYNAQLEQIARIQADQMVQMGLMQHDLPGARYPDMRSRADAVGYRLEWLGENLAYNYPDAEGVVQGWIFSQGHRENLLHTAAVEMGVSVRLDQWGRVYVALEMGQPRGW